ncbi:MAG TPA: hypothetical protein VFW87_20875 [Pirellulales bacterium]|nr:hypothetical protein [Pirellulales bacterium]
MLVVNSAHLASLASPDSQRWLPIFWALDHFKDSQADDVREGDWTMSAVDEARVPKASQAKAAFVDAMDNWDEAATDAAAAGLARATGVNEIYELMFRYGARDFRDIGHKAIYVANSLRTLNCIGYQHTEPVLRSLAYALLQHEDGNPAKGDDKADLPWRKNVERAKSINPNWEEGALDPAATADVIAALREGSEDDTAEKVVEVVNRGAGPQAIWDAMFLGAGELLVRRPGIVALHAVTTTNALRYAWDATASDDTRRMLLLQNAAFLAMFRQAMGGKIAATKLDELQPIALADSAPAAAVKEIFAAVGRNGMEAAGKALAYLDAHPAPQEFVDTARLLIFLKGSNAHDYKFSSAVLEDYRHLSAPHRARYLAASVFNLRGSNAPDNTLVQRTRSALG